jgi:hypothetical protein
MEALETYLQDLRRIRYSQAGTDELAPLSLAEDVNKENE